MQKRLKEKLEDEREALREKNQAYRARLVQQLLGVVGGIGLGLIASALLPVIRERFSLGEVILWGGAIGGMLFNLNQFEQAGAQLTRNDNRLLNYAIGLGIPLFVVMLIAWLS